MYKNEALHTLKLISFCSLLFVSMPGLSQVSIILGAPNVEIGGDMDGESFVSGGGSSEILPDQDKGSGSKIGIGAFSDKGSFEFTIVRSDHDGEWLGIPTESEFESFNFDAKFVVAGDEKLKGLLMVGLGFMSVKIKDGSTDGFRLEDAEFNGLDFRFGGGARYRVSDNIALEANAVYRYGTYNSVDGIVSGDISDSLDGDGLTTSIELIYIFGP